MKKHGDTAGYKPTKEYRAWQAMHRRCRYEGDREFPRYGGRGIKVCERWASFEAFLEDMGRAPSAKHTMDRIDNDKNYEPGNCRWTTYSVQRRNASHVVNVTIGGETMCLKDWCARLGLRYRMVHHRIRRGWTPEEALATCKLTTWDRRAGDKNARVA